MKKDINSYNLDIIAIFHNIKVKLKKTNMFNTRNNIL